MCSISHNSPFRTEMCTFLFWMMHCGIWNCCIVGFVRLVYCARYGSISVLTHCSLMMPYGFMDLGQQWIWLWLGAWWHQAITWSVVDIPVNEILSNTSQLIFGSNHLALKHENEFENNLLKWPPLVPCSNELRVHGHYQPINGHVFSI